MCFKREKQEERSNTVVQGALVDPFGAELRLSFCFYSLSLLCVFEKKLEKKKNKTKKKCCGVI